MAEQAAALKAEGNAFLKAKKYPEAVAKYTEAIALDRNHVFFSNRCAAYLYMNEAAKALADAEECIKISPNWAKGYLRKGASLHKQQKYMEAFKAYQDGLKIAPNDAGLQREASKLRSYVMQQQQQQQQAGIANLFSPQNIDMLKKHPQTAQLFADGQMEQKLKMAAQQPQMMQILQQDPNFMKVLQVLITMMNPELAARAQQEAQAQKAKEEAAKDAAATAVPKGYGSWAPPKKKKEEPKVEEEELTAEEIAAKQAKEKEEAAKKAVQEEAEALKTQGNEHYKKKEFEQAIEFYNKAIAKDPNNISFITNIAAVQMAQKKYDEAVETCTQAIKKGKEVHADYSALAKAYARLGTCYFKKKDYDAAIREFENAQLEDKTKEVAKKLLKANKAKEKAERLAYQDPEKAKAAKDEGNKFFKESNFPKAIERYSEAIKRNPKEAAFYQNRSAAYSKLMEFGMALKDCEKALEINPKYVKAWARKAKIEHFLKKYHKALESAQKGLEIDPNDKMCLDQLRATHRVINENMSKPADPEAIKRAQEDPEIRAILSDPVVNQVIQDMSKNPGAAQKHMSNPGIAEKINKLIAAGILRTGGA